MSIPLESAGASVRTQALQRIAAALEGLVELGTPKGPHGLPMPVGFTDADVERWHEEDEEAEEREEHGLPRRLELLATMPLDQSKRGGLRVILRDVDSHLEVRYRLGAVLSATGSKDTTYRLTRLDKESTS